MDSINGRVSDGLSSLAKMIASFDWSATSLGPIQSWQPHIRTIVDLVVGSSLPIVTLWGRDGYLIYNDAYAAFAGARHPALLGAKVLAGWPEAAALNSRVLAAGFLGESLSFRDEQITLHRHGYPETIWLDLDYSPIRDGAGRPAGVFCVLRETTARVKLEQERAAHMSRLNDAQTRQRSLVELSDKLRTAENESEVATAVGEILGRSLGCTRAGYAVVRDGCAVVENDWTSGAFASLRGRYDFSELGDTYITAMQRGDLLVVPDVKAHPATSVRLGDWLGINAAAILNLPLHENGVLVALLYAHQAVPRQWTDDEVAFFKAIADRTWDAMGRTRALEALRWMNETLEEQVRDRTMQRDRMWTLSTDLMMISDQTGKILSVNPAWTSLLGWGQDELVGGSFYDFIHPDYVEMTRVERQKLHLGRRIHKFENRYRTKAGGAVWLSWTAVPDGGVVHSVARDITAEREQAEALQAAEESLRHAQKMEAVGQLTGGIAHDFNNLLQGIMGALELAQKRIEQGRLDGLGTYTAQARQAAERASALTHRLLAFSRRQPLAPKPVQANPLILAMEPLLRRTLGEMIELRFDLTPGLGPVLCDPNQLDSAILNLAINARDAMPDGGTLTICSRNASGTPERVQICVADTGTGMAPDVVARAFDPFFTTKPIGQGTGLGLSMVYGFIHQSGGEAKISSKPGAGTVISLLLPQHVGPETVECPTAPAAAVAGTEPRQGTVLVLEDETVVREIVVEALHELGFHTIEASTGPAGLEILQSAESVDLLVTDIGLPGLNGRQVAEAARLIRPDLKILFMTGYAETATMSDGFLGPGMHMITKPFAIDKLSCCIESIIRDG
jgi:PAS domain S-box-containing protein